MDIKEIKLIVDMMKRSDLTEFEIEEKDLKLRICREGSHPAPGGANPAYPMVPAPQPMPVAPQPPAAAPAPPERPAEEKGVATVKSPMVGTFYRAPSPESPPFVEVGTKVNKETVVCIIEAMKVMNEIQSEIGGVVTEILVENGDPVEYGQPLFKVKTA